jgi:hypothetical protein
MGASGRSLDIWRESLGSLLEKSLGTWRDHFGVSWRDHTEACLTEASGESLEHLKEVSEGSLWSSL